MAGSPARILIGLAAAATCAGLIGVPASAGAAVRQPEYLQIIAHPDDDLLFMSPDLSRDIDRGAGVMTVVLTSGEGHAGLGTDTHSPLAYVTERRQGLEAAYAGMAGVRDTWRVSAVRAGRVRIELHTLTARPEIQLAFLSLPDGRDPRAAIGRRALAQLRADTASRICSPTVTPPHSPYAHCYTHADVVRALVTLMRRVRPTVVRAQDPAPDRRYTADHTDHIAAAAFATEAVRAYGRPVVQTYYRDYNLSDTAVNLGRADVAAKERDFATYRAHDYRINPEAKNFASWQERMRYRWPRGASWVTRGPAGRLQAFAVLSGRLYTWWQTATGWAGPASLGGDSLAPSIATAGGRVFALRNGSLVMARPRRTRGRWTATWTVLGAGAAGAPVASTGRDGRTVVFTRDATGAVAVKCERSDGSWTPGWQRLRGPAPRTAAPRRTATPRPTAAPRRPAPTVRTTAPAVHESTQPSGPLGLLPRTTGSPATTPTAHPATSPKTARTAPRGTARPTATPAKTTAPARRAPIPAYRDVQDGMAVVGGVQGIELFAPTRNALLQWRQTGPCAFAYSGAVPGVRPGGPVTAIRDASGHPTLFYEQAGSTAIRQAKEISGTWSPPATPLRAVFHVTGEPPVPTGSRVPAPPLPVRPAGVPAVGTDGTGQVSAIALGTDDRMYVSVRGPDGIFGTWSPLP